MDNVANKFNEVLENGQTAALLQKPLGEMIHGLLGEDRIRNLFDDAGKTAPEHEGQAMGDIALKLGVISNLTKTALLVAQAATRALNIGEKAELYARNHDNFVKYGKASGHALKEENLPGHDAPIFKYVGSPSDFDILKSAQATWVAAQLYYNNEVYAINSDAHNIGGPVTRVDTLGAGYGQGFRRMAVTLLTESARLLEKEGHAAAGAKISAFAAVVAEDVTDVKAPGPDEALRALIAQEQKRTEPLAENGIRIKEDYYQRMLDLAGMISLHAPVATGWNMRQKSTLT